MSFTVESQPDNMTIINKPIVSTFDKQWYVANQNLIFSPPFDNIHTDFDHIEDLYWALYHFTGDGYTDINSYMRNPKISNDQLTVLSAFIIFKGLQLSFKSITPIKLYRGVTGNFGKVTIGQVLRNDSFSSYTTDIKVANGFIKKACCLYIVTFPIGSSFLYLDEISQFKGEEEYLVPPGKIVVTNVSLVNSQYIIEGNFKPSYKNFKVINDYPPLCNLMNITSLVDTGRIFYYEIKIGETFTYPASEHNDTIVTSKYNSSKKMVSIRVPMGILVKKLQDDSYMLPKGYWIYDILSTGLFFSPKIVKPYPNDYLEEISTRDKIFYYKPLSYDEEDLHRAPKSYLFFDNKTITVTSYLPFTSFYYKIIVPKGTPMKVESLRSFQIKVYKLELIARYTLKSSRFYEAKIIHS